MILGFRTPFPIRIPCPVYPNDTFYKPLNASFASNRITIEFARSTTGHIWCYKSRTIDFDWYPSITSHDEIITFHANRLQLDLRQKRLLKRITTSEKAGAGTVRTIDCEQLGQIEGKVRTGGSAAIYVLSQNGRHGCLRIDSSIYNSFNIREIEVGSPGRWRTYPKLDSRATPIRAVGRWTLKLDSAGGSDSESNWTQIQNGLIEVLGYTEDDCKRLKRKLPCEIATGYRYDLERIRDLLIANQISSKVQWSTKTRKSLDWYDMRDDGEC